LIAALILVLSVAALIQFGIAQWRSIWISIAEQPLSASLQTATGIPADAIGADDFEVLARTSEQLCPSPQERNVWLKEVRVYYRLVRAMQNLSSERLPALAQWSKAELVTCSRYAGAVLDQRLNANLAYSSALRSAGTAH
jgi:hypothetical protein